MFQPRKYRKIGYRFT